MDNKEGNAERMFKNFGKKADEFVEELQEASERLQKEFQEKYEELKDSAEKIRREAKDSDRWKEVENSLKKAGQELGKAFKNAFK